MGGFGGLLQHAEAFAQAGHDLLQELRLVHFACTSCRLFLHRLGLGSIEHNNVADAHDQMAAGVLAKLRSEFLLLVLEIVEFHLDQFVVFQSMIQRCEKLRTEALLAHLEGGFEPLGLSFEIADLRITERKHATRVGELGWDATKIEEPSLVVNGLLTKSCAQPYSPSH